MAELPKLTVRERVVRDGAPKTGRSGAPPPGAPAGTRVQFKAFNVRDPLPQPEHMFVEYDDGDQQIIARGGPSAKGGAFFRDGFDGNLMVRAEVSPAAQSPDYGKGQRVVFEGYIPGRSATETAQAARDVRDRVNSGSNLYGWNVNSNSYASDVADATFGRRVGDDRTPGYKTRLEGGGLSPQVKYARALLGTGIGSTPLGERAYRALQTLSKYAGKFVMPVGP